MSSPNTWWTLASRAACNHSCSGVAIGYVRHNGRRFEDAASGAQESVECLVANRVRGWHVNISRDRRNTAVSLQMICKETRCLVDTAVPAPSLLHRRALGRLLVREDRPKNTRWACDLRRWFAVRGDSDFVMLQAESEGLQSCRLNAKNKNADCVEAWGI